MSESTMLTAAFLAVASPLVVAVSVIGAGSVRDLRHAAVLRRVGRV